MCVFSCMWSRNTKKRDLSPNWAAVPRKKIGLYALSNFSLSHIYLGKRKTSATGKVCWTEYPSSVPVCLFRPKIMPLL